MTRLRRLFTELGQRTIDPTAYEGRLADAAFEVLDTDSFIAGIASTLIEGGSVESAHLDVLRRRFLLDSVWTLRDGTAVDLSTATELLEHAQLVDAVHEHCARLALPSA